MKTALLYKLKGPGGKRSDPTLPASDDLSGMAASFETAVMDTLIRKCLRAAKMHAIPRVLIGGGVACNRRLRSMMAEKAKKARVEAIFARPEHCTDNAVMIAGLGHARLQAGECADLLLDVAAS
jgi:N6-L-threonylcarbamoyladenine synthase